MDEEKNIQAENGEEENFDFCITAPKWQKICFIVFAVLGTGWMIGISIFFIVEPTVIGSFWGALSVGFFLDVISAIGLYAYHKEKFIFKDGLFTYVKTFKKSQSARIEDISCVCLTLSGFPKVTFYSHKKEVLISFLDDGTAFNNQAFLTAIMAYGIPYIRQ